MAATIARPSPTPPVVARARGVGAVEALEHAREACSSLRPGPAVGDLDRGRSRSPRASVTCTGDASGVCARTFASRLSTTWRSRSRSPSTTSGVDVERRSARSGSTARAASTASRDDVVELDRLALERPALVEPREQQQVVDEQAHPLATRARSPPSSARDRPAAGPRAAREQLGVRAHRRERRAQLVRRVGDEAAQPLLRRARARGTPPRSGRASR